MTPWCDRGQGSASATTHGRPGTGKGTKPAPLSESMAEAHRRGDKSSNPHMTPGRSVQRRNTKKFINGNSETQEHKEYNFNELTIPSALLFSKFILLKQYTQNS